VEVKVEMELEGRSAGLSAVRGRGHCLQLYSGDVEGRNNVGSGVKGEDGGGGGGGRGEGRGVRALNRVGSSSSKTRDDENVSPSIAVEIAGGCSSHVNETRGGVKDNQQNL
jgi:hypothetical protein